jgi:hypothetical protein
MQGCSVKKLGPQGTSKRAQSWFTGFSARSMPFLLLNTMQDPDLALCPFTAFAGIDAA